MDERFRLVFRGEVLDGQHRAVVKRRLGEALKLDEQQLAALFSDRVVVLKRRTDAKTAAHYQLLFKNAGARLRVVPVAAEGAEEEDAGRSEPLAEPADLLSASAPTALTLQENYVPAPAPTAVEIEAPAFDLAAPGSRLADPRPEGAEAVPNVDFELAEVGADLLPERPVPPVVELGPLDFEIAEPGTPLGEPRRNEPPAAPDTSHIRLVER